MSITEARQSAEALRAAIRAGAIPYKEGRKLLADLLAVMDQEGARIAAKYGKKHHPISINSYLR